MGRIEYEYPLFKVYYSNNSNNSNIHGNRAIDTLAFVSSSNVGPTPPTIKYEIVFTNDSTKKLAKFANIF